MSTVVRAGAVEVTFKSDESPLLRGLKRVIEGLKATGDQANDTDYKSKALQDAFDDLTRRSDTLKGRLATLTEAGKENGVQALTLKDRIDNLTDRIATQSLKISAHSSLVDQNKNSIVDWGEKFRWIGNIAQIAIGNMIADAFGRAISASKEFVTSIFKAGGETEKQGIAFKVLTGSLDNASVLMEKINNMAVKTPFDIAELRDVTKQMLSFGISQEEVIPLMTQIGDITAGTGGDLTLLGRAYGQVKTKGKLYAQELNQLGEQGVAVRETLASMRGISVADLVAGMSPGGDITVNFEEFNNVMKKIHDDSFMNLMSEQADSASGKMQNLGETLSLTGQEIIGIDTKTGKIKIGSIFDEASKGLTVALEFLSNHQGDIISFFTGFTNGVKTSVDALKAFSSDAYNGIITLGDWISNNKELVITSLVAITGALVGGLVFAIKTLVIPAFIKWAIVMWTTTLPALGTLLVSLLPFILIGALVALLIAGIYLAFKNWGTIMEWVGEKWNGLLGWFNNLEWVKKMKKAFIDVGQGLLDFWNSIPVMINNAINAVVAFITPFVNEVQRVLGEGFWYTLGYIIGKIALFSVFVLESIQNVVVFLALLVAQGLTSLGESFYTFFTDTLPGAIVNGFIFIGTTLMAWGKDINDWWDRVSVQFINTAYDLYYGVIAWLTLLPERTKSMLVTLGLNIQNGAIDMKDKFINGVIGIVEWFKSIDWGQIAKNMIDGLIQGVKNNILRVADIARNMGESFEKGFKDAMGIHSPSTVMIEAGINVVEGLDIGIARESLSIDTSVNKMANTIIDTVNKPRDSKRSSRDLTINQYGANLSTSWIPFYAR